MNQVELISIQFTERTENFIEINLSGDAIKQLNSQVKKGNSQQFVIECGSTKGIQHFEKNHHTKRIKNPEQNAPEIGLWRGDRIGDQQMQTKENRDGNIRSIEKINTGYLIINRAC